jgi:arylsulfatase A-like enzyme
MARSVAAPRGRRPASLAADPEQARAWIREIGGRDVAWNPGTSQTRGLGWGDDGRHMAASGPAGAASAAANLVACGRCVRPTDFARTEWPLPTRAPIHPAVSTSSRRRSRRSRRTVWSQTLVMLPALCALLALCSCDGGAAEPSPATRAGAAGDSPSLAGAPPITVEVNALDIIEAFGEAQKTPNERVRIVTQNPQRQFYCGPGNFERDTQLASDQDHRILRAPADSAFEVQVGPLRPGAHLLARTLVYSPFQKDPQRADPAPVTFRILVDGVEKVALRSDYILKPSPTGFIYDQIMRTLDVKLPETVGRTATLRFEVTRLGAPEPAADVPIPEPLWWDLAVQEPFSVPRAAADRNHPNILFLVVDTLAARHMSLHGYARDTTPQIAAFAAGGLRFDRALSMSSWTLPATASLLSGLSPNEHGVLGGARNYLVDGVRTWPEVLQEQGLQGGAFIANTLIARGNNFQQGFDHWEQADEETAAQLDTRLLAWLDGQPKGARWFGYVQYMDPHAPYAAPGDARHRFDGDPPAPDALSALRPEPVQRGEVPMPDATQRRQLVALYDAEVAYVDKCVGELVAALRQRGLLDDTLVVLTADHGEELFDHGKWGHGYTLYDELLHVPLVVVGPGFAAGRVRSDPVSTAAIGSLLLDAAHLHVPDGALRMPAPPAAGAPGPLVYSAVRTSLFGPQCNLVSVQDASRKLIWTIPDDPAAARTTECFDLRADPLEQRPLKDCDAGLQSAAEEWFRATAARRLPEPQPDNPEINKMLEELGYIGTKRKDAGR